MSLFELEWLGGEAEQVFRRHRGDRVDAFDWALDTTGVSDEDRDAQRITWTRSAHLEWCAAGAFATLQQAMLVARAPVDLIGMSGRFLADEMVHVELACRMAAAWGGGAPLEVDPAALGPRPDPTLDALPAACALAIRTSCVGETFSQPMLAHARSKATGLAHAVLDRIVRDETPHARLGWLLLDWAAPRLSAADRVRLAEEASDAIAALRDTDAPVDLRERVLLKRVVEPLRRRGIAVAA
ncbi:MAG: hypothetical protein H6738_04465 [Alphaproteobacteria bacterium]|nr:hypothetical protein [Alphaproteobacteria bacterium]MCB9696026.1 hypothetical protein [Alphaproteobacteria bacterium]